MKKITDACNEQSSVVIQVAGGYMKWYPADEQRRVEFYLQGIEIDPRVQAVDLLLAMNQDDDMVLCSINCPSLVLPMEVIEENELLIADGAVWFRRPSSEGGERYPEPPSRLRYTVKAPGGFSPWGTTNCLEEAQRIQQKALEEGVEDIGIRENSSGKYLG
ncbi:MAG: hypothetical protein GF349_00775 [Candidatus Magasanikbacteria bacterium]|nr:hypothetical protein [Candidatus Magasanikbacteria bacterium]